MPLQISVAPAAGTPAITSVLVYSDTIGTPLTPSYQITTGVPATSFQALGLPAGLLLNSATGLISGTPTQSGTFPVALSAFNANGQGASATLILTISSSLQLSSP
jgi:hypothetical protein